MNPHRNLNREECGILIAILATIFGGFVRLYPAMIAGFPINDGGLFVAMIEAIKINGLKLPLYFQYNRLNIPFAYPPLAFFIGALLSNLWHLSPIDIVRWLPGIVSVGTVPAFFYLSNSILNSSYQAGLATLAFAFTPRTFTWAIMGGGLTRSFGLLFLLLSLGYIYRLFKEHDRKYLFAAILFCALVVLSHPEAMVHTITCFSQYSLFATKRELSVHYRLP
jgi:Dolichyl-phosphate-mannose-protein mannosyltransferase